MSAADLAPWNGAAGADFDSCPKVPALSIVAPCFNEEACLAEFVRRVTAAAQAVVGTDFEIVLVDDGSRDRTWALMAGLAAADSRLTAIRLARNFGHQRALAAGLYSCRGDRVLVIDADLQDPPELLADMMALMDAGADVVYGQRRHRAGESRFKSISARLFYRLLTRLADVDIPVDTGDFRLMNRRVLDVFRSMPEEFQFIRGMISWIGMTQVPLQYDREPRLAGETGYSLMQMLRLALDALTGFSVLPLRIASYVGMLTGITSVMLLAYSIGSWLLGKTVDGWTSLASIVLILGSVQLLVLGVLGEYLGRLFMASKRRPRFVVQEVCRVPEPRPGSTAPAATQNVG
ncbi:glycosyltransferase family 2 protein [Limobrevibacterium gyesilva]|uniref:Glycosyltransferase family 2 protein n=1 Tax=Limobrevibacterium gyesilva TaxID=2991712 RepID=A0AA42CDK5_9PROT|nr:glycosyltransferase family 2 protein [Limobrevibacterium gyesilva]MCW3474004.1 glycosyltransferase family 2 protein [Limobrevibacterium gyesilva]